MTSEDGEQQAPIIIVKKNSHGGHHGGAWKVAYADFVTSMMSLFIVLWIVAQDKEVKQAVGGYFRDPGAFHSKTRGGVLQQSGTLPIENPRASGDEGAQSPEQVSENALRLAQEQELAEMAALLQADLERLPAIARLKDQIEIRMTDQGLNVQLVDKGESFFFEVGRAALSPQAESVLTVLATQLGTLPNMLAIEGHTDSRPYPVGAAYTNWELSADRANCARRFMLEHGLKPSQLAEVRGFADTRLRNPADATDVANRRISITVLYKNDAPAGMAGGGGALSGSASRLAR